MQKTQTALVVDWLNKALELDPDGIRELFDHRVPISTALEADEELPFVIGGDVGTATLGPLGMLNGVLDERIAGVYEPDDQAPKGLRLVRFELAAKFA